MSRFTKFLWMILCASFANAMPIGADLDEIADRLLVILEDDNWKHNPSLYNQTSLLFKQVVRAPHSKELKGKINKIKARCEQFEQRPMAAAYRVELEDKDHRNGSKLKKYLFGESLLVEEDDLQKIPKVLYGDKDFRVHTWVNFADDGKVPFDDSHFESADDEIARIFVLDRFGQFYMHEEIHGDQEAYAIKHSSFFCGKPVAGSGKLIFDRTGQITTVTNSSGHYRLGKNGMRQTLIALKRHGVDLSNVRVSLHYEGRIVDSFARDWNLD